MRNWLLAAALLLTGARFALAGPVDPALFNAVAAEIPVPQPDKYDERAVLAALLARPDMADQFNADGKDALSDPQLKPLFIAKWRGKAAAFATTDVNRGGPDLSKQYHNWKEVLGPEGYAYTRQRLLTMSKDNVDKLIGYLGLLDEKLKNNNYKIDDGMFAISGKIVNGILDAYRKDLGLYLNDPAVKAARAGETQVAQQLASGIQSKNAVASAPPQQAAPPAAKPGTQPVKPPVKPVKPGKPEEPAKPVKPEPPAVKPEAPAVKPETPVVVTNPSGGALDQARGAERAGPNGGQVFDGGGRSGTPDGGSAVVVPPSSGAGVPPGTLTPPSQLGGQPPVVGAVPSPLDDLDARVAQAGASGVKPYAGKAKLIGAGGGALLGGLLGFLLGGPIGLAIGAAAGAAVGYFAAHKLLQ